MCQHRYLGQYRADLHQADVRPRVSFAHRNVSQMARRDQRERELAEQLNVARDRACGDA